MAIGLVQNLPKTAMDRPPEVTPPRATQSDTIGKLAEALSRAQGSMELASKDASNPHFQSKFASLASCIEAMRKPLADNGLAYVQRPSSKTKSVRSRRC